MTFSQRTLAILAVVVTATAMPGIAQAQEAKSKGDGGSINDAFANPDVPSFVKRFESEDREVYSHRKAIADSIGLKPGMSVADIGAGTGAFTMLFAEKVGPSGKVYAVDIARPFLEHIAARAKEAGLENVKTVVSSQDGTNLDEGSVDLVYLCDTYHHFEHPEVMLASIQRALKPGGRLVLIDFDRHEGSTEFVQKHIRAPKETFFKEIQAAGFDHLDTTGPPMKENFFAVFQKKSAKAEPAR